MLIVNKLEFLWDEITLNYIYECQGEKYIHAILIFVSYDVLATRKIYGYVSALISYHQYKKKVNYENQQHNFAGINDLEE